MNLAKYLAAMTAAACLQGCTLLAVIVHNFPGLDDGRVFAARTVARSAAASPLRSPAGGSRVFDEFALRDENGVSAQLAPYLEQTRTAAFVVLHNDSIVYECYGRGYDERSLLNSFSIAKSVVATLVGIAIADGSITSLDDKVEKYRPEFAGTAYGHDGQYLYVSPKAQVVIVTFSETRHQDPVPMFRAVADALTTPQRVAGIDRLVSRLGH